jgi:hypothetical protein
MVQINRMRWDWKKGRKGEEQGEMDGIGVP